MCIAFGIRRDDSIENDSSKIGEYWNGMLISWRIPSYISSIILKNVNIATHLASDSLVFVDVSAAFDTSGLDSKQPALRSIYETTSAELTRQQEGASIMVILDDISSLEWTGVSSIDLFRFVRALRSLCLKVKIWLIVFTALLIISD